MMVTTGGRGTKVAGSSGAANKPSSTSDSATRLTACPISSATSWAVSASITSVIFTIWPCFMSSRITSTALRHAVGELLDGDRLGDRDFAHELFFGLIAELDLLALDAAAERRDRSFAHLAGVERRDHREAATVLLDAGARRLGRRRRAGDAAGAAA